MKHLFSGSLVVVAFGASVFSAQRPSAAAPTSPALLPHTHLEKSEPGADSTVTAAPKELKLFFSEAVKPSIAGVRLLASDSSVVTLGALKAGEGKPAPLVAPVTGVIRPGKYRVMWHVAGDDGHPIAGSYVFTVKPKSAN